MPEQRASLPSQTMHVAILENMQEGGIADRMIREYGELAGAMVGALDILTKMNFRSQLSGQDAAAYDKFIARITNSAERAKDIIHESSDLEVESHLVLSQPEGNYVN